MRVKEWTQVRTVSVIDGCHDYTIRIKEWDDGSRIVEARTREEGKEVWLSIMALRIRSHHYEEMMKAIRCVKGKFSL